MTEREKVIKGLERHANNDCEYDQETECPYWGKSHCSIHLCSDALALLKDQQARVMTLEEVKALPYGYVLLETDKAGSLRWVDALLFCKSMDFSFYFITLEGRAKLLGTEYNKEWRCWTSRPTIEQIKAIPRIGNGEE